MGLTKDLDFFHLVSCCQHLGTLVVHPHKALYMIHPRESGHQLPLREYSQANPLLSPASQTMAFKNDVMLDIIVHRYYIKLLNRDWRCWIRYEERNLHK